jgi:hypothetical protein
MDLDKIIPAAVEHILFTLFLTILFLVLSAFAVRVDKNKRVTAWLKNYLRDEGSDLPFQNPKGKGLFLAVVLGILSLLLMVGLLFFVFSILFYLKDQKII